VSLLSEGLSPSGRRRLASALSKLVSAVSLAGLAFMATYSSAPAEFSAVELRDVLLLGAAVHALLLGAALAFLRSKAQNAVLALIVTASVGSSYLVHTDLYLVGSRAPFWGSVLAIWVGVFAVFGFMDEHRLLRGGVPAVALLALTVSVVPHLGFLSSDADPGELAKDVEELIHPIAFEETPNLYFIALDGLSPQSLGQEYLGIETTSLVELVNTNFRRLPNMFSESRSSREALNALVYLDKRIYQPVRQRLGYTGHVTGVFPSPLYEILRANGYQTTFVSGFEVFGSTKGPYLDNLEMGTTKTVCYRLDPSIAGVAFWGYCNRASEADKTWWNDRHAEQIEFVASLADRPGPQFVLAYVKLPGHTDPSFDYSDAAKRADFRETYVHNSTRAAHIMIQFMETIEERDPHAIVLLFGDHGMKLTYNMAFYDDPEFYVKDNLGVLGGLYPRDACEPWFDETLAEPYVTTIDVVHTILRCLSGGEEALVEPLAVPSERKMRSYWGIPNDDPERSLLDYLYE